MEIIMRSRFENNLKLFEPGAQGEHKISRGFLPTPTWSAHWIADEEFRIPVKDFLQREQKAMLNHIKILEESSPYHTEKKPPIAEHFPL